MSSEIKANSIQSTGSRVLASDSGSAWSWGSGLPSGSIVQVQSTQYTTNTSMTSVGTSTDYVICSGTAGSGTEILNVNITPRISGSKIWLQGMWCGEFSAKEDVYASMFFFYRNAVKLANTQGSPGARQVGIQTPAINYHEDDSTTSESIYYQYFDIHGISAGTQITYKMGVTVNNGGTIFIGGVVDDTSHGYVTWGISSIVAIEIAP